MWKRCANVAATVVLLCAFGFLLPLTFARRMTATGLIVCLGSLTFAGYCASVAGRAWGTVPGVAAWSAINLAAGTFWIWLVFHVSARTRGQPPGPV